MTNNIFDWYSFSGDTLEDLVMPWLETLWYLFFPIFNRWRSCFNKYRAGGMACAAWSILPINNYSVSVLIFVEDNESFMLLTQVVCSYFGRNTLKEWVFMSHTRQVLRSARFPSPVSFLRECGLSRFSGSDACSGCNSVWMTNKAALFTRSIQYLLSTVMITMLSMNPSIDDYLASMFTARGSDFSKLSA